MVIKSTYTGKDSALTSRLSPESGFSLVELIMVIVILGGLSVIMIPFIQSFLTSSDPMLRQQAVVIAQSLLDEITSKRWDENTPIGGGPVRTNESNRGTAVVASDILGAEAETRATYDDVDDYNSMKLEKDNFRDQNGNVMVKLNGFTRSVAITYIDSNSNQINAATAKSASPTTDTKLIIVTVKPPIINETYTFVSVACNL